MYRFFLALRYLRSRLVNLISIGGVMAGVAVLIVVVSIMDGFQARVRKVVRGSLSHIILTPTVEPDRLPDFEVLEQGLRRDVPEVEAAAPQVRMPIFHDYVTRKRSVVQVGGRALHQMEAVGIDWAREREVSELAASLVVAFDPQDPFHHPDVIPMEKTPVLVSRTFAENFMLGAKALDGSVRHPYGALRDDATGERLRDGKELRERARELIGTELHVLFGTPVEERGEQRLRDETRNLLITGVYDLHDAVEDNQRVYLPIGDVRSMGHVTHAYLQVNVRLKDYQDAPRVKAVLAGLLQDRFVAETWEDQKADFLTAVNQEKVLLVIVLSFIVLLGGFIILATLTLTVVEKTRDIGIVAALGAGSNGILSIFLWNGLLIGLIGSVMGLGLGGWFTAHVDDVKDFLRDRFGIDIFPVNIYHFRSIPTVWDWPTVLWIMTGSVLVAFFAGLLPALRASRLDPIKALRYE